MATALDLLENIKKINLNEILKRSLNKTKDKIVEYNIEQLDIGEYSTGKKLPEYSAVSVEVYEKQPGSITLYDTGAFYEGINVKTRGDSYLISSSDSKNNMLIDDYGDDIFGLQEGSKQYYVEYTLEPEVQAEITKITGLKFE
jgi:hypothetical protein